jgi:hypothetical protein
MAFLINWLDAIGAIVLLALFYNNAPLVNPQMAGFGSLMALVFLGLSYVVRVNSEKMVPVSKTQALIGFILVLLVVGAGVYFAAMQMQAFTTAGQYATVVWMFFLEALIVGESLMTFKGSEHPLLERRLFKLHKMQEERAKH